MPATRAQLDGYKARLRRTQNLAQLQALSDRLAAEVDDPVTITRSSFEGGFSEGETNLLPSDKLTCVEELIRELDPDNTPSEIPLVYDLDRSACPVRL